MKRRLILLALFVLCLLGLSGCTAEEEVFPELILRYADNQTEDYPTTKAAEYFAELVEERTGGKIRIRVYPNGQLGDEISVYQQIQFGGIDFTRVSAGTLAEFVPEAELLQLPYLFTDADHMWRVLDGEIGEELMDAVRFSGVVGLSWFEAGARNIYTRTPVHTLEDLAGMKIRVQESDLMSQAARLWGAEPVQLTYSDVYSALQTGKIDGAENNWPSYESTGHFETAPYYLLSAHFRLPEVQIVSTVALDRIRAIDESFEEVIFQCAREAALYERELWQIREAESETLVRERGCIVTELSSGELEAFRLAVQPMYDGLSGKAQELVLRILES